MRDQRRWIWLKRDRKNATRRTEGLLRLRLLTSMRDANRREKFCDLTLFEHIATGARRKRLGDEALIEVGGVHQDLRPGLLLPLQRTNGPGAVDSRQPQVH